MSIIHYPNLKTVLLVEGVLKKAKEPLSREEIKRRLPVKIMHQTLNVIIGYLEESGKILDTRHGPVWTYCPPEKMAEMRKRTIEVTPEYLRKLEQSAQKGMRIVKKNAATHRSRHRTGSAKSN